MSTEEKLLIELNKFNSIKRRFLLSILTGFGGAIGATIIAAVVFYFIAKAIDAGSDYKFINDIIELLKIREIFEETCK